MKTLEEYNRERRKAVEDRERENADRHRKPMGVECPKCKAELRIDMTMLLTSNPPQRNIFCEACGHHGYALA